jgi:DNA-binding XRE family transcriptional regulator
MRIPKEDSDFILKNHIKEIRQSRYLSQAELASRVGVCKSTISMWENGIKGIKDKHKIILCKILKCEITTLFDRGQ